MNNNENIKEIKKELIPKIEKLINIIKSEYIDLVKLPTELNLNNLVHIEDTGTISLFIRNGHFYFPTDAFKVLNALSKIPGYGSLPNHKTHNEKNMILNNNTYLTYMEHVFLKGLKPKEYYEEILLHETLHFCGSGGGTALREGINELKTRELAQKYNLLTSACGYPKETKIAYELQQMFGSDIINKIAFSNNYLEIKSILDTISLDAAIFYFELEHAMEMEFNNKYMKYDFPGITGPIKKTQKYNTINYSRAYQMIEEYKRKHNILTPNNKIRKKRNNNGFVNTIILMATTLIISILSIVTAVLLINL